MALFAVVVGSLLAVLPAAGAAAAALARTVVRPATVGTTVMAQWHNLNSGLCLSTWNGNVNDGTGVIQSDCSVKSDDQFWIITIDGTYNKIRNLKSSDSGHDQCLGVGGASTVEGWGLVTWNCNDDLNNNQLWKATRHGSSFVLWNKNSGYVVAVAGGSKQNAAQVEQYHWYGQPDANWWAEGI
jgi:hypothetical protein